MENRFFRKFMPWILCLLLSGCTPVIHTPPDKYRIVTEVEITYENNALAADYYFSDQTKIQYFLDYLRRISPYGTPKDDPEKVAGSDFYIVLRYSDGTTKSYHQRADRFMRIDSGPWKRIDPDIAIELSRMLGMMTGDSTPPDTTPAPSILRPQLDLPAWE